MWNALATHLNDCELPTALISEERLSLSTVKQATRAVDAFPHAEVHCIVTARDLGRVLVSQWQEAIKNDKVWRWTEYAAACEDRNAVSVDPARSFWIRQDLVKICETWEAVLSPERVHVVTVPGQGSPPDELLRRFSSIVGFDPDGLTEEAAWNNETVGVAATEAIRRVNDRLDGRLNQRQYDRVIKGTLVPMMARRTEPVRFSLPAEDLGWVTERANETIAALETRGYPVVGDLAELRPSLRPNSRRPDDATDEELLEASLDALALLTEAHATSWWARKKPDEEVTTRDGVVGSHARAFVFRGQRKALKLAERNRIAAKAATLAMKARDRTRTKALKKPNDTSSQ
jgi:hypothetical protein